MKYGKNRSGADGGITIPWMNFSVILRRPRSDPRRMQPRRPGRRPSRLASPAPQGDGVTSMPLEILHRAFVPLGRRARIEGAEIAAPAGLRVFLARIEAVFAGGKLADHGGILSY